MTEFIIGDESYAEEEVNPDFDKHVNVKFLQKVYGMTPEEAEREVDEGMKLANYEVNTSYDQEQPIGDAPQHYPAGGAEPIDAKTGQDFLDISWGEENWKDVANKIYDEEKKKLKKKGNEKLNKDGTGTAVARRGINPNNKKHIVMKFDYVSKSDCPICKPYDGKSFGRDSPNRPVIPRLERVGNRSNRPYTHPNCKCRWTKVFNEVSHNHSMNANEIAPELLERASAWHGDGFDKLAKVEKQMVVIKMLKQSLGMNQAEEFDFVDPVPLASMATLAFDAIKPSLKKKLGLEYAGQPTGKAHNFGIQSMLDNLVGTGIHEAKKKEIEDKVSDDFTLENLLNLTAKALADKLGKKLGVESVANEWDPHSPEDYVEMSPDILTINDDDYKEPAEEDYDEAEKEAGHGEYDGDDWRDKITPDTPYCEKCARPLMSGKKCDNCGTVNEGGRGSGKLGHEPWFLGAEIGENCEFCMCITEKEDGKCMVCGN